MSRGNVFTGVASSSARLLPLADQCARPSAQLVVRACPLRSARTALYCVEEYLVTACACKRNATRAGAKGLVRGCSFASKVDCAHANASANALRLALVPSDTACLDCGVARKVGRLRGGVPKGASAAAPGA